MVPLVEGNFADQQLVKDTIRRHRIQGVIHFAAKGYVGESMEKRQPISIARAFLKDAPILLLDEPASSVDSATEAGIIEAIERLMRGRTVFTIAHRLSTLRDCDMRLELNESAVRVLTAASW